MEEKSRLNVLNIGALDPSVVDKLVWTGYLKGEFSIKAAFEGIRLKRNKVRWRDMIWNNYVPIETAANAWKLLSGAAVVDSVVQKKGVNMESRCYICKKEEESLHHLLWDYDFTKRVWKWLSMKFRLRNHYTSISEICKTAQGRSPMIKQLRGAPTVGTLTTLCGNLGNAGLGATFRNSFRDILLVIWRKIGVNMNYIAECLAILESVEMALIMNWTNLWIESDSVAVVASLNW
ncbi:hypothetical protein IFM89_019856 [Coptis chinensis]|uniref:RNase H type-1 domain-containing protein n=1 Tax=Coptis chinensis TaxID=261450 RepID=A0A835LET4_9MAGN|nr:hypothetical protein IFM89_019856 [Coptis chinensis]